MCDKSYLFLEAYKAIHMCMPMLETDDEKWCSGIMDYN